MMINALNTVKSNLTEVCGIQVLFDGLSIAIIRRSIKRRKCMADVGTEMVSGFFGNPPTTFCCCFGKKLVFKVLTFFFFFLFLGLKSLLFPLNFPYMDSYVTSVLTEWL